MKFSMSYCSENKRFFAGIKVNFLLTIFKRKDEIFCRITVKTSHWTTFRERCLYFSNIILYGNKGSSIIFNFLKICSQKLGY